MDELLFKPLSDGRIMCYYCPCTFFKLSDYIGHLERFTQDPQTHAVKLQDINFRAPYRDYPVCIYKIERIILDYKERLIK